MQAGSSTCALTGRGCPASACCQRPNETPAGEHETGTLANSTEQTEAHTHACCWLQALARVSPCLPFRPALEVYSSQPHVSSTCGADGQAVLESSVCIRSRHGQPDARKRGCDASGTTAASRSTATRAPTPVRHAAAHTTAGQQQRHSRRPWQRIGYSECLGRDACCSSGSAAWGQTAAAVQCQRLDAPIVARLEQVRRRAWQH
jgi:hypothetical protein